MRVSGESFLNERLEYGHLSCFLGMKQVLGICLVGVKR